MSISPTEALAALATITRAEQKVLIGRLGRDPEMRHFQSGVRKAEATIAINRLGEKDQADWFKVEVWADEGEEFTNTAKKGDLIEVTGRMKLEQWTDKQTGEPKWQWLIRAEDWRVVRPNSNGQQQAQPAARQPVAAGAAPPVWNTNPANDGGFNEAEIPF